MTEKPAYRGRRQTSSRLPVVGRTTARCGAITTFIALTLIVTTLSAMAAPIPTASQTGASVGAGDGTEAFLAPLRQSTTDAADSESPTNSGATSEASDMAAIVAVLNRQGVQGPLNLQRVSAVPVANLATEPELVVDARTKRAAEAEAAASELALTVQATVEAQEAEAARKAAALAAVQKAEAESAASITAAAIATETARASAAEAAALTAKQEAAAALAAKQETAAILAAKQEAEVRAAEVAATTRNAQALAAAAVESNPKMPDRMSSLLIAFTLILGAVLGFRLWRSRKEPFVLKANPISASSSARA
jgi:hypothetical protein